MKETQNTNKKPNQFTRKVPVGNITIGRGSPIVVQSMLNAPASDAHANIEQAKRLEDAGCELIRMTVPNINAAKAFERVCNDVDIPVVADIHFSSDMALAAINAGADKIRINPGNLGGLDKCDKIIESAKQNNVAIRIGVNAGSLDEKLKQRKDLTLPQKLAASAKEYVDYFYTHNFYNVVVSAKAHGVTTTIETNRLLSAELPETPLHLGVTEAGTLVQGCIKSAAAIGVLLEQGIGDTIRISLTDDPVNEVSAAWTLLSSLDIRKRGVEIISCPTCGRTKVDLIGLTHKVEAVLKKEPRDLKVAVMGCIVNGPGEAEGADIGVACSNGKGAIFVKGEIIKEVPEAQIVDALLSEIDNL